MANNDNMHNPKRTRRPFESAPPETCRWHKHKSLPAVYRDVPDSARGTEVVLFHSCQMRDRFLKAYETELKELEG